jgi:hypothetical protein
MFCSCEFRTSHTATQAPSARNKRYKLRGLEFQPRATLTRPIIAQLALQRQCGSPHPGFTSPRSDVQIEFSDISRIGSDVLTGPQSGGDAFKSISKFTSSHRRRLSVVAMADLSLHPCRPHWSPDLGYLVVLHMESATETRLTHDRDSVPSGCSGNHQKVCSRPCCDSFKYLQVSASVLTTLNLYRIDVNSQHESRNASLGHRNRFYCPCLHLHPPTMRFPFPDYKEARCRGLLDHCSLLHVNWPYGQH